jgi:DNA-binding protein H-NS
MAKKKRGRPPGSKNKPKVGNGSFAKMDVDALRGYIGRMEAVLAKKIQEQRQVLEGKLAELSDFMSPRTSKARVVKKAGTRRKAAPKYQSKATPSLKWSGRGMTPVWMRDEMKGTKLKKDDFLIH